MKSALSFATPRTRKTLEAAARESSKLEDRYVGTEHLLIGTVRQNPPIAGAALKRLNLDYASLIREVRKLPDRGHASELADYMYSFDKTRKTLPWKFFSWVTSIDDQLLAPLSTRARLALEWTNKQDAMPRPAHILLGIISQADSTATTVLKKLNVDTNKLRCVVEEELQNYNQKASELRLAYSATGFYAGKAVQLATELESAGEAIQLVPSTAGVFKLEYKGETLFSKNQDGRFPEDGEILRILRFVKDGISVAEAKERSKAVVVKVPRAPLATWLSRFDK